jgi:hypothetical protein
MDSIDNVVVATKDTHYTYQASNKKTVIMISGKLSNNLKLFKILNCERKARFPFTHASRQPNLYENVIDK